ncbi:hypothetical protein ES702_04920 [subsurface metagenome]
MKWKPDNFQKEGDEAGAVFNIGLSTAMEIRKLLNECNMEARLGRFIEWYNDLLALEREVTPEMKEGDDKKLNGMRPKLIIRIDKWQKLDSVESRNRAFVSLHLFEIELRQIIKKRGLGMPDKDDDEGL